MSANRFLVHHVKKEEQGKSLLDLLQEVYFSELSKKKVKSALDQKACVINGKSERFASRKLKEGDKITFDRYKLQELPTSLPILFEDAYFLAIDKPPFITVSDEEINRYFKKRVFLVHRLDKETTGVLLLVKRFEDKEAFEKLFRERSIHKIYHAICSGKISPKKGEIEDPIAPLSKKGGQMKMEVNSVAGKFARTMYKVLKEGKNCTYVACEPITGRSHQIRVHLATRGHPIIGDHLYGSQDTQAPRIMLHSLSISFTHPMTQEAIKIESVLPDDFRQCLKERELESFDH
jgi:RluA family pseudouridine synthase